MTKREKEKWLKAHRVRVEKLVKACGGNLSGQEAMDALAELEREAHRAAEAYCNGTPFTLRVEYNFGSDESAWDDYSETVKLRLGRILGSVPIGFFVNGDARGHALKLEEGTLSDDYRWPTDWGKDIILSPEVGVH